MLLFKLAAALERILSLVDSIVQQSIHSVVRGMDWRMNILNFRCEYDGGGLYGTRILSAIGHAFSIRLSGKGSYYRGQAATW